MQDMLMRRMGKGELHFVDAENRSTTAESFICTAKEDVSDAELTKRTSTHNAWLDSHIEIRRLENFGIVCFEDFIDCTEFSMANSL
jgi:hypothetical protein